MKREDILKAISELAKSQGFYGRLLRDLTSLDEEDFEKVMTMLEDLKFTDTLDLVLFLEG